MASGKELSGEAFNFGPNADQNHTVLELLEAISKFWHSDALKSYFEIEMTSNFHEAGLLKLNCDKSLHFLQWKPVLDFGQTAAFTGEWYDHYYNNDAVDMYNFTCSQLKQYEKQAAKKELLWVQ
jgi:CDP-glucose 4,6-dehydratase